MSVAFSLLLRRARKTRLRRWYKPGACICPTILAAMRLRPDAYNRAAPVRRHAPDSDRAPDENPLRRPRDNGDRPERQAGRPVCRPLRARPTTDARTEARCSPPHRAPIRRETAWIHSTTYDASRSTLAFCLTPTRLP